MATNRFEKEANQMLESAILQFGKFLVSLVKFIYWGIRGLNTKWKWLGFLLSCCFAGMGYLLRSFLFEIKAIPVYGTYLLYYLLLFIPLFYIMVIGSRRDSRQRKYQKIFQEIGFKGKDNKYPYFLDRKEHHKKVVYLFQSNLSLAEWKGAKDRLETGLDCTILSMENGSNKKRLNMITVPSDCKIPDYMEWSDEFLIKEDGEILIGREYIDSIRFNLNRNPHVLIAGETGSGKSVLLRHMLWQMICNGSKIYMFDFKGGVEFGKRYEQFGEVVMERQRALHLLEQLVVENESRLHTFRDLDVKNLKEYNKKTKQNLCRICLFCDEIAEMLDKKGLGKEEKALVEQIEGRISTLARLSRATGINLFLGVQRPDANILTGQIKNNIPVRICGRFADKAASEIVLGNTSAVGLPDIKGRFLYKLGNETIEFQSYYFDDDRMLKEVDREVGEMMTQTPKYEPKKEKKTSPEALKKVEPLKKVKPQKKPEPQKKLETQTKKESEIEFNFEYGEDPFADFKDSELPF